MLKVLGKRSSINVRKVLWTLDEVELEYQIEEWGAGYSDTNCAEFLAKNPGGLVPVLEDHRGILTESNAICRYLASRQGRYDLLPTDPFDRACVERWMDWQISELNPAWSYAFQGLVRRNPACQDPGLIAESLSRWERHMNMVSQHLASSPYMAGNAFTLADIAIGLSVYRWSIAPIERQNCCILNGYLDRLRERPAFMKNGSNGTP